MSGPFSQQCQNLCLLNLAFIIDWKVVNVPSQNKTIFSEKWGKRINPSYVSNGVCMQVPQILFVTCNCVARSDYQFLNANFIPIYYQHVVSTQMYYIGKKGLLRLTFSPLYTIHSQGLTHFLFYPLMYFHFHISCVHFLFLWYGLFVLHFLKYNSLF